MATPSPFTLHVRHIETRSQSTGAERKSLLTFFVAETSGAGGWESALVKARDFVSELTLEEKSYMVTGHPGPCVGNIFPIPRLNFSGLCLQDGPAALRDADFVSVFPSGVTIASSWDRKMMYDRAAAMGREFKGKGAQIALA